MRGRMIVAVAGALVLSALPAAAAEPHITDAAGDAAYGPADLVSVTFATAFEGVLVGDDGIDHQATGLLVRWGADETPGSAGPTIEYGVRARIGSCSSVLKAYVTGPLSATDDRDRTGLWHRNAECLGGGSVSVGGSADSVMFSAKVLPSTNEIEVTMSFASLSDEEAEILKDGVAITVPVASTWVSHRVDTPVATYTGGTAELDTTAEGRSFVVGSDMPADVACTTGCP